MTHDLFIGMPAGRTIRKPEMDAYYKAEAARPASSRVKNPSELPAQVRAVFTAMQGRWPDSRVAPAAKTTSYSLSHSSFTVSLAETDGAEAHEFVRELVYNNEATFLDLTSGGWLTAAKPADTNIGPAFTCEKCVMRYVGIEDLRLLLAPDWFSNGKFFCLAPGDCHWVQVLDYDKQFYIEFRAGPSRPLYRSIKTEIGPVAALLQGYLRGQNMNTPEYQFKTIVMPPDPDAGLPVRRDAQGRWLPK